MDFVKKLFFERVPGMAYVLLVVSGAVTWFARSAKPEGEDVSLEALSRIIGIALLAWLIYVAGRYWDDALFDPLYSVPDKDMKGFRKWWWPKAQFLFRPIGWLLKPLPKIKKLPGSRLAALEPLEAEPSEAAGLHKTAVALFAQTEAFEKAVKPYFELSKAARSFILPLIVLAPLVWVYQPTRNHAAWLTAGLVAGAIAMMLIYVYVRAWHMVNLYDLVGKATVFRWTVTTAGGPKEMICVNARVVPLLELPIFTGHTPALGSSASG